MFEKYEKTKQKYPIKIWLPNESYLDNGAKTQAMNLANLPFVHKWVCLMPDTHQGYGMPIGGVLATDGVIIPNAVGVDIGCGMGFIETNIKKDKLNKKEYQKIIDDIGRAIPTGFKHHKKKQKNEMLDKAKNKFRKYGNKKLFDEFESAYTQLGTLGGGNHFIELQVDDQGTLGIMLHSGSRNFGYKISKYFNNKAKIEAQNMKHDIPENYDLAYLPEDSDLGKRFIDWMNLAMDFARENRKLMMDRVKEIINNYSKDINFEYTINAHHNYAKKEKHYGKEVWVHRKGAISAKKGEYGIIPGAMGSNSYIVEGLGNEKSFYSCSHGAGRKMSRRQAKKKYSVKETISDLKSKGILIGNKKHFKANDESRWAYKDIDFVINQEKDLIKPIKKLSTVAIIKG
ncbi:MAG: RtcB family protein [Fusobacteriota bacterium]